MAKLKAELQYQHHQDGGTSLRDRLFANVDTVSAVGSLLAPLPRLLQRLPGSGLVVEKTLGIAKERDLPQFRRETLTSWADGRESAVSPDESDHRVILFPDTYTNYSHPAVGKAAVRVLEAANCHVQVASDVTASGRAAFSKGFLDVARDRAETNVETLAPMVEDGWNVVVVEPSDAVMFQSDYLDLLSGDAVETVAANTYGVCEFVDRAGLADRLSFDATDVSLAYHGHCHQTAIRRDHHAVAVLRRAGYEVTPLDSGCCGMAGSFGYEAEHYSMSRAIGSILESQLDERGEQLVVAPGASCRTQLESWFDAEETPLAGDAGQPPHPVELLARVCSTADAA